MTTTTLATNVAAGRAPARAASVAPVSRHMRETYLRIDHGATVGETLDAVRRSTLPNSQAAIVLATGLDGRYAGFVRISALVRANAFDPIAPLLEGANLVCRDVAAAEDAARLLQKHDLPLLPVVDARGGLLGVLTVEEAMDVLEAEDSEDMYKKAGIADLIHIREVTRSEKLTQGSLGYPVKVRIAFLMVTLVGGLTVGGLIDQFEEVLSAVIALAIFIPLIMDMGGNVGTQSTTIFARGLALGHIKLDQFWRKHLFREFLVGVTMAALLAVAAGTVAYFWQGAPNGIPLLGVVVALSLFFAVTLGSVLGFLLPYLMLKVGLDHAPGADPFITTIKDFSGLAVYFLLAVYLLDIAM